MQAFCRPRRERPTRSRQKHQLWDCTRGLKRDQAQYPHLASEYPQKRCGSTEASSSARLARSADPFWPAVTARNLREICSLKARFCYITSKPFR